MQLIRRPLLGYENRFSAGVLKEETADIIVPDSFPDILNIIDTRALACVREKRITENGVELAGAVRVSVLYKPDDPAFTGGFNTVKRLEVVIPFTHLFEQRGVHNDANVFASVSVTGAGARTINPRKVGVTAGVRLDASVFAPYSHELTVGVSEAGFETLLKQAKVNMLIAARDKIITVNDQIELPSGRPPIGEILNVDVRPSAGEVKIIGTKAVLKGSAAVSVLYQNHSAEALALSTWEQEIIFSQIIEMDGADESAEIIANLTLSGIDLDLRGDGRTVDAEITIDAQLLAFSEQRMDIISDAYSTVFDIAPDMKEMSLYTVPESFSIRAQARESGHIEPAAHSIIDTQILLGAVEKSDEGGNTVLRVEAIAKIIYTTEEGEYACSEIRVPVEAAVANPDGHGVSANVRVAGDVFAGVTADGLEVRFTAQFEGCLTGRERLMVVDGIRGDTETPKSDDGMASVTLRRLGNGETLWDIAKRYSATQRDILAANAIPETAELEAGTLLLIPRKR
ncbi:MAG: DUF3794 domain-containing protein [Oscillospiraceae bacterium]|nr:DUF3794 domain-containing protein [Oscillospiraceae bacterium]